MAETTTIFTPEQTPTLNRLRTALSFAAPVLVLAGLVRLAMGVVEIATNSWGGLLILPEGPLLVIAGLAFLAGSADVRYLGEVKGREKEHLSNALTSVNDGFTALLILGCYEAVLAFIQIWV